ncbi:hypothetical protein [Couchioplanes caeruleus]|uniref:Uncharacterized protein n=1 Tax=Couchioplanes caeruleus TaxID=56438 RepID=A0A3N1GNK0_9ACTN|nr:hypothetical protein [Couchioplanes caeruleus]ROP31827.1 hypothetical protein EDD30_4751 [Couchioplanes caeruleus]
MDDVVAGAGEGDGEEAAGADEVDDVDDSDLLSDDEVEDVVVDGLSELPLPERESLR